MGRKSWTAQRRRRSKKLKRKLMVISTLLPRPHGYEGVHHPEKLSGQRDNEPAERNSDKGKIGRIKKSDGKRRSSSKRKILLQKKIFTR